MEFSRISKYFGWSFGVFIRHKLFTNIYMKLNLLKYFLISLLTCLSKRNAQKKSTNPIQHKTSSQ